MTKQIKQPIANPTHVITTDGTDQISEVGHSTLSVVKEALSLDAVPNLDTTDAVNKAHDQNTDTALDLGGANEVTAADARAHIDATDNPHNVTATQVGLGDVDNVSAADLRDRTTHTGEQAISTVTGLQSALDDKADKTTTFTAGVGLDGGGDLSANRTFDLDSSTQSSLGLADTALQPGDPATDVSYDSTTSGLAATDVQAAIDEVAAASPSGYFAKADRDSVAWTKTGNGTAETSQTIYVEVGGSVLEIGSGTSISMPTLTVGTDYAIWCAPDGTLEADTSFTTAPTANGRLIGGFHYAPGGNATGTSGGNTTNQINQYSFWDLKFRPTCEDPRGMTLFAGWKWADIYLLNTNPDVNGTSAFGVTIADGSSPPIIPAAFGGNGSTTYGSFKWYECQEVFAAYGKKAPTYAEFMALAYGVTEETDRGSDPGTTQLDAARTSKWGVIQATGNLRVWGRDVIADGTGSGAWRDIAEGRGEIYTYNDDLRAGLFGGSWYNGAKAGSRSSAWDFSVARSLSFFSGRGVADHLVVD